ncbi:hypothetical protein IW261DRAFT_1421309 [Armillaria novae-zelandiae]|uniref:Uncharacterized protein n=1 Tax=Armillaria novae-zelandiae TaxID=153914 RepID=A0AA39P3V9_9AGAR|nr:hypothetical protein IW261DRAFT_1421309 [Armillaria novae-zelandiae]
MDEFYDIAKAKDIIQQSSEESTQTNKYHLSRIIKIDKDMEELVFACTGVICEADLPPVNRVPSIGQDKMIVLAQSVTLTGLGCTAFDKAIATLQEIRLTGEREFKNRMLDKWTPSTYRGYPAFKVSNQYFRTTKEGSQHEAVAFSKDVDPVRILQRLGKTDMAHTEDNEVQYFKANIDSEGRRRFQRARPQLFRVGDIVEVQCSIIIFKARGAKHRMKLILRAIAMLDCDIMLDAKRMSSKCTAPEETGSKCLKQKIGFGDEDNKDIVNKQAKEGASMDQSM